MEFENWIKFEVEVRLQQLKTNKIIILIINPKFIIYKIKKENTLISRSIPIPK